VIAVAALATIIASTVSARRDTNLPGIRFEINPNVGTAPGDHYCVLVWQPAAIPIWWLNRWSPTAGRDATRQSGPPGTAAARDGYQPRARHSGRDGRSAPSVEFLPWPG
jgi:hypothetical protein